MQKIYAFLLPIDFGFLDRLSWLPRHWTLEDIYGDATQDYVNQ